MTVRPRGAGYQANFTHRGKRYIEQFSTESAAAAWELEAKAALIRGSPLPQRAKAVGGGDAGTLQNVFRRTKAYHWDRLRGSQGTIVNAETFVKWSGAAIDPKDAFSQGKIEEFVIYLMEERRVSNTTINKYMSAIRKMADTCKDALLIMPELPFFKIGQGRIRFFSNEEEGLIIQTLSLWGLEEERDFFVFLMDTGARPWSEAVTLKWQDVVDRRVTFWETKTGVSRAVPTTQRAKEAMDRQRLRDPTSQGPFSNLNKSTVTDMWRRLRAHIPALEDTVLYTARHTCCTRLVQRGIDLRRVQVWMGHNNIQTTMRYAHFSPDHLMEAVAVLETRPPLKAML